MVRMLFVLVLSLAGIAHAEMRQEGADIYLSAARSP